MCITINEKSSKNFLKDNKKNKVITAYKYYDSRNGEIIELYPPIYFSAVPIKFGIIKSDRENIKISGDNGDCNLRNETWEIYHGIHVYLKKKFALMNFEYDVEKRRGVIVEVQCNMNDFVGEQEYPLDRYTPAYAVFTQVTLSKEEYNKAIKYLDEK